MTELEAEQDTQRDPKLPQFHEEIELPGPGRSQSFQGMAEAPACSSCWWLYWFYWDHSRHSFPLSCFAFHTVGAVGHRRWGWKRQGLGSGVAQCLPITAGMVDLRINSSRNNSWRGRSLNRKEKPSEKCCGFTFSTGENFVTKVMVHKDDFTGNEHFESFFFARKAIPALTLDLTVNI